MVCDYFMQDDANYKILNTPISKSHRGGWYTKGLWPKYFSPIELAFLDDMKGWSTSDYCEWLWRSTRGGNMDESKLIKSLIICWHVWSYQNAIYHNKQIPDPEKLHNQVAKYMEELSLKENTDLINTSSIDWHTQTSSRWIPFPYGMWKLSCHVVWNEQKNQGGNDCILR